MSRHLNRAVLALQGCVSLLVGRATLSAFSDSGQRQLAQFSALPGEVKDNVERIQQYGLTSSPLPGAQLLFLAIGGNRDHPVIIAADDPKYRPALNPGEVALYTNNGDSIIIRQTGEIVIKSSLKVTINAPSLECTGDIIDHAGPSGHSMAQMRAVFDQHTHTVSGGVTAKPTQKMGEA